MKKIIISIALSSAMLFSNAFNPSANEKSNLDGTLNKLMYQDDSALKSNHTILNKLLSSHNVIGGYEDKNYKYTYYMNLSATDKLAIFIITKINNPNYGLIKSLNMKENFILLIDANTQKKLVWAGYTKEPTVVKCDPLALLLNPTCTVDKSKEINPEIQSEKNNDALFDLIKGENSDPKNIISDLNLFKLKDNIKFEWISDDDTILNADTGKVTRQSEDRPVELFVEMSYNTNSTQIDTQEFNLLVKGDGSDDDGIIKK